MAGEKRVFPGDQLTFSASLRNRTLDAIEWVEKFKRSDLPDMTRLSRDRGVVKVQNDTVDGDDLAADRDRFDIVGLSEPLFTPADNLNEFKNRYPLRGVEPAYPAHKSPRFGVLLQPCRALKVATVCMSGLVPARLSVTHENDIYCGIEAGEYSHLLTGGGEVPIIWKDTADEKDAEGVGLGWRWGIVLLGCLGNHTVRFELLENYAQFSTTPVQAARRYWNPEANSGNGGWVSDCDDIIYVCDFNGEGFEADAGGIGKCHMIQRTNSPKWVGEMYNLCCIGDEQGECGA